MEKKDFVVKLQGQSPDHWLAFAAGLIFALTWWSIAWISDDAYLTFRTIEVWFAGHGPNFNPGQRVFGTTSPLWFFAVAAGRLFHSDPYWVALVLSGLCMVAMLYMAWRWLQKPRAWAIFVLLLTGSRALMDYSSSGLETPLSCVLLTAFVWCYSTISERGPKPRSLITLATIGALVLFTRHDLAVFVGPALLWVGIRYRDRVLARHWGLLVVVVAAPLGLWSIFSLIYYGSPFPPAGIAKLGFSKYGDRLQVLSQGLQTLWVIAYDPVSLLILALGLAGCVGPRHHFAPMAAGGLLYIGVYIYHGGDWMDARIFVPLLVVLLPLATWTIDAKTGPYLLYYHIAVALALALLWPAYGWNKGRGNGVIVNQRGLLSGYNEYYRGRTEKKSITVQCPDWAKFEKSDFTVPSNSIPTRATSTGAHYPEYLARQIGCGQLLRESKAPLGGVHILALGLFSFHASPDQYIVEETLLDPLLTRLPPSNGGRYLHHRQAFFRPGHVYHDYPRGYIASLLSAKNLVEDPAISALFDDVYLATQAPLFAPGRLAALWRLNTGHDYGTDAPWEKVWGPL